MRQLFQIALLGIVAVCWLVLSVRAQVRPSVSTGRVQPPTAGYASATQRTVDSLQRLTQPGYYSTLFAAKKQPKGSANARLAVGNCNSYLCTVVTSPALSISLTNNGPLTCGQPQVGLAVAGGPASSTYVFSAGATQPGGPLSNTATVTAGGPYSVTVIAPGGTTATAQTTVTADQNIPLVGLSNDGILTCAKTTVLLSATGDAGESPLTYRFSPGVSASGSSTATVTAAGIYSVTAVARNGCSATASTTVTSTTAPPSLSISPAAVTICAGQAATLTATDGLSYQWSNRNGEPTQTTRSISATATGIYSVTATNASGCSSTASASVTVSPSPQLSITPSATAVCAGQTVTLTATPGLSYRWSSNGEPAQTTQSISVTVTGIYSVTATNTSGCSTTASASVTVNPLPQIIVSPTTTTICSGQSATLTASTSNGVPLATYLWSTGQTSASITTNLGGIYSVRATTTGGCSGIGSATLTVAASTPVSISPANTTVCEGQSVTLTATSGLRYRWSSRTGEPIQTTQSISATATGIYSITATNAGGCSTTASASVTVNPATRITSGPPASGSLCAGSPLSLSVVATGSRLTYQWYRSKTALAGQIAAVLNLPAVQTGDAGSYSCVVTGQCGSLTNTAFALTVNARPPAPFATPISRKLYTTNMPIPLIIYALPTSLSLDLRFYGANNVVINPAVITPNQAGIFNYYATQTDGKNCVSLPTPVSLTVLAGGTLVSKPADRTVCQGATSVLSVTATGSNLNYTWYKISPDAPNSISEGGSSSQGTYTNSLTVSNAQKTANYYCLVSGQYGIAIAGPVKLTVNPNCRARSGVEESDALLTVRVLGNPVRGSSVTVEVRGAEGQPLHLQLMDTGGRAVSEQRLEAADIVEQQTLHTGNQAPGLLLLRVSTPTQSRTVKVLKMD